MFESNHTAMPMAHLSWTVPSISHLRGLVDRGISHIAVVERRARSRLVGFSGYDVLEK